MKIFWYYFRQNKGALLGLSLIAFFTIIALLAPIFAPHDAHTVFTDYFLNPPYWYDKGVIRFLLGNDDLGRDLLSRLIYGAQVSMGVGFLVVFFSMTIGSLVGLVSGYVGGLVDNMIMRLVDIIMALPSILLAIVVVAILGPNLFNAVLAVSFVAIPGFVRIVRASVLAEKNKPYVTALKTFGSGHFRILVLNIFPNCLAPLIVQGTLAFSDGILNVAALGFLGLGAQPPTPEWGTMLSDARPYIESSSWLVTLPGLCILLVVLGFNLLGDGLRDAFDPKLRK